MHDSGAVSADARQSTRDAEIVQQAQAGVSIAKLGRWHGISRQRVSQILHSHGIRFSRPRTPTVRGHGTRACYRRGCRCSECRAANVAQSAKLRGREAPRHGVSGYDNYSCRCDVCRAAKQAANAAYRRR